MTSSESNPRIIIVGGGIAGLASALALTRSFQCTPQVTVFELRETPSTIGGAVNLTPNAIRYLDQLGVLAKIKAKNYGATIDDIEIFAHASGARIATLDFTNASGGKGTGFGNPPFKALRIRRADLLEALLLAVGEKSNVKVVFGKKAVSVDENTEGVTIRFEDGSTSSADCLLGCDGIHSAIRAFIEPTRKPVYSGIAVINGFTTIGSKSMLWKDTVVVSCKQGSFMASYFEPSRNKQYVAGVVEMPEVRSKEGWRAKGRDQEAVEVNLRRRFGGGAPALGLDELIASTQDWLLYPVYKLPPGGQWTRQRTLLLGDAAHAVSLCKSSRSDSELNHMSRCHLKAKALELRWKT